MKTLTYIYEIRVHWLNDCDYRMVSESKGFYATEELAEKAQRLIVQEYIGFDEFRSRITKHELHSA